MKNKMGGSIQHISGHSFAGVKKVYNFLRIS